MSFALAKVINALRSIMNKPCITLVSFYHHDMLAFDILVILAKPEPWPLHQEFMPTLRAESCNP